MAYNYSYTLVNNHFLWKNVGWRNGPWLFYLRLLDRWTRCRPRLVQSHSEPLNYWWRCPVFPWKNREKRFYMFQITHWHITPVPFRMSHFASSAVSETERGEDYPALATPSDASGPFCRCGQCSKRRLMIVGDDTNQYIEIIGIITIH